MPVFTVESSDVGVLTVKWSVETDEVCGELIKNNVTDDSYETVSLVKGPVIPGTHLFSALSCDLLVETGKEYSIRLITYKETLMSGTSGSKGTAGLLKREIVRATDEIIGYGESKPQQVSFSLTGANRAIEINLQNYSSTKNASNGHNLITDFEVFIKNNTEDDEELITYPVSAVVNNNKLVVNSMAKLPTRRPDPAGEGLRNQSTYSISIRAVNDRGAGPFSSKRSVMPDTTIPQVTFFNGVVGHTQVALSWTKAALGSLNPANTSYYLYKKLQSAGSWDAAEVLSYVIPAVPAVPASLGVAAVAEVPPSDREAYTFSSLNNGDSYMFKIVTKSGSYDSMSQQLGPLIPYTKPDMLDENREDMKMMDNGDIQFVLNPPANTGGMPIIAYKCVIQGANPEVNYASVALNNAVLNASTKVCSFTVPAADLVVGTTYMFQIYSFNGLYSEPYAEPYKVHKKPDPPTNLVVSNNSSNGNVTLTWDEPANRGGVATNVLEYEVLYKVWVSNALALTDTVVQVGNARNHMFSGLLFGKKYDFRVRAYIPTSQSNVESWESGADKFVSAELGPKSCIPAVLPLAPSNVVVGRAADKLLTRISWDASDLNGLVLSKYQYKIDSGAFTNITTYSVDFSSGKNYIEINIEPNASSAPVSITMRAVTVLPLSDNFPSGSLLESNASTPVTYIVYKAPTAIGDLELFPVTEGIELRWSEPTYWGGYLAADRKIYINNYNTTEMILSGNSTRFILRGLTDNSAAAISVISVGLLPQVGTNPRVENDMGPIITKIGYPNNEPAPPTELVATPGDKQVKLNWVNSASYNGPAASGSSPPSYSYVIFRDERKLSSVHTASGEAGSIMEFIDYGASGSSTAPTLVNGQNYTYRVVTKQVITGVEPTYSDNFEATSGSYCEVYPQKLPSNLSSALTLVPDHEAINASWVAPSASEWAPNGLLAKRYYLELWDMGAYETSANPLGLIGEKSGTTTAVQYSFSALTNGKKYEVRVYVEGQNQNVPANYIRSAGYISAQCVPSADANVPVSLSASVDDRKITLTWKEPAADAYSTYKYNLYLDNAYHGNVLYTAGTVSGADRLYSYDFTQLINGRNYSVTVSRFTDATSSQPAVESDKATPIANKMPVGPPIISSASRVASGLQNKLSVVVDPNGSRINSFVVYAVGEVPGVTDVVLHAQSSISSADQNYFPLSTTPGTTVTLDAYQLSLSSRVGSSVYVVCINLAGKYVMQPLAL